MSRLTNRTTSFSLVIFVASLAAIYFNQQSIFDWSRLRNYTPSADIAAIATNDGFTDYGRKIFYVNHPEINDKTAFGNNCDDGAREQTIVLGCYHGNQRGIFVLNVTDPRLTGVKRVTAAHEMLHAAYDRLNNSERNRINGLLQDYYKKDLKNERLLSTIDAYKKSEPNDVVNEMHSIFGTEVASLPAPLEKYYTQYFKNRATVVSLSAQYQAEFTSRKNAVTDADRQLDALKQQIDAGKANLDTAQSEIDQRQKTLNTLRSSNNISAYNAGVGPYNQLINDYNAQVQRVRGLIAQFNQLVETRNAIAIEEGQLVKSLSAEVDTINN